MASLLSLLLLAVTSPFLFSSTESSRKELRDKETMTLSYYWGSQLVTTELTHHKLSNSLGNQGQRVRVFMYEGFLSDEECDHLMSLARGSEKKTLVGDDGSGSIRMNGMLSNSETPLDEQVILLQPKKKIWSDCTKTSNIPRPIKGNAILFFTRHPDASPDTSSTHARCPVLDGDMWYALKLFFVSAADGRKVSVESDGSDCTDGDDNCFRWAAIGKCQRNPVFP